MQTWLVESSSVHRLVDAVAVAQLVDAIGSQDPEVLARCILDSVEPALAAQQCTVFAHEAQRNPRLLSGAAQGGPWVAFQCGARHAREFSAQDSLREVLERKPAAGPVGSILVCRQRVEDMPADTLRLECLEPAGLVDRLTVLVRNAPSSWLAAHLWRDAAHGCFGTDEIEGLIGVARLIGRCLARHYACDVDGLAAVRGEVSERMQEIGSRLTEREREVLTRILDGVTVNRIAEDLNLRPTTVATYRLRAYEKLGVATRQELFATVLRQQPGGALPSSGIVPHAGLGSRQNRTAMLRTA
jgi:DNA-binding CsgD family transcriptional regulator